MKRFLLLVVGLFLLRMLWLFGWVLWWERADPRMTRFMEIRAAGMRAEKPERRPKKSWANYDGVSIHLKRALVASEDSKFIYHRGFDWKGIRHAIEANAAHGKIVAGGSTITQQLAKNLFLSPEKTPLRKAEEALITLMIESTWEKRRILEVYINVIEWGDGVFGAESAARHYFGVSASRLAPGQAATLAAMVPRPRFYDKNRNAPELLKKRAVILQRMPLARIP
jgi:monofunctional biosynthetic peptidoglycan transglycosylase